jgi:uncharacterized membrane protein YhfC
VEGNVQINPMLVASYAVAVLVDVLFPLAVALFLARRFRASWWFWLLGVLVFLVSQVLTRIPALSLLQSLSAVREVAGDPRWFWPFLFVLAFTAGLFEEGGRWLAFRWFVPPAERSWRTALMLGAGHGGLESIGIGLLVLLALVNYVALMLLPAEMLGAPAEQVAAARATFAGMQGWEPLLGAWERVGTVIVHVGLTVLVVQSFSRGRRWWWYALAAHTLLDFGVIAVNRLATAAWGPAAGALLGEALVGVCALLSVWLIVALRPRGEEPAAVDAAPPAAVAGCTASPA